MCPRFVVGCAAVHNREQHQHTMHKAVIAHLTEQWAVGTKHTTIGFRGVANIDQSLNSLHRAGSFEICNARQRGHKHWKALQGCGVRAHAEVGGGEAPLVRTPTPDTAHHHHNAVTEMVMAILVMVELITG